MKTLLTILILSAATISLSAFRGAFSASDPERIEVVFNAKLAFEDLVRIKDEMSQKGIELNYKMLQFDDYGKLSAIHFKVDCKDGNSGSAKSTDLRNQHKFGFFRDNAPGSEASFGTGDMR